jgi:hypothetical protein
VPIFTGRPALLATRVPSNIAMFEEMAALFVPVFVL